MNFLYGTDEGEEIYPLNKEDESIERKYRIEHLKDYIALCQGEIEAYQSCLDNSIKEIKTLEREEELDKIERFEKLEPLFEDIKKEVEDLKEKLSFQNDNNKTINSIAQIISGKEDDHEKICMIDNLLFPEE